MVFTVGRRYIKQPSDTPHTPGTVPLLHYKDIDDLIDHLPHSCPLVGVEMGSGSEPLSRFGHLVRAAYLLGAEDHGLSADIRKRCHYLVEIETPVAESMNVACAGSVLMYDRYTKMMAMRK